MKKKIIKKIILALIPIMVFCIGVNNASADTYSIEYKYISNLSTGDLNQLVRTLRGGDGYASNTVDSLQDGIMDSFQVVGDIKTYDDLQCTSNKDCYEFIRDDYCSCYQNGGSNCGEASSSYNALCGLYVDGKQNPDYNPHGDIKSCSYSFQSISNIKVDNNQITDWDLGNNKYSFFINVTNRNTVGYFADTDGDGTYDEGLTVNDSCFQTSDNQHRVCLTNGNKGQDNFESEFKQGNTCPEISLALVDKTADIYIWEAIIGTDVDINNWGYQITNDGTRNSITDDGEFNIVDRNEVNGFYYDPQTFNSCEELLGPTLTAKLQSYLNIIRILIPIAVIALGMLDFAKAVIASDENKMKESQKKFIRRLLIAVAIFFVPTLLNLVINIINAAWGNVVSNSCTL